MIFILFFSSASAHCATNYYYYLQVGSFEPVSKALHFARKLRDLNENALIRGEDVPGLGFWHRVYLGPYSSYRKADHMRLKLRKRGFYAENAFVRKKTSPIQSNVKEETGAVEKAAVIAPEKEAVQTSPPEQATVSSGKAEIESASAEEKSLKEEPSPSEVPAQEKSSAIKEAAPTSLSEATSETSEKTTTLKMQKGHGRNIARGKLAVGVKHTYLETKTEVTERKLITSNGTTTTTQNVSLASFDTKDTPTSMHISTIRMRFGLTDCLEIFADLGSAYDKLSDPEIAYGGGARLNLFETPIYRLGKLYFALQGEYLGGKLNSEYSTDTGGYRWDKETDWEEFAGKMEFGIIHSKVSAYIGGLYFLYREDTDRRLLQNIPTSFTSYMFQDTLKEEYNYGVYGGVVFHFTNALILNIEGQIINQKRVNGTLEYHF